MTLPPTLSLQETCAVVTQGLTGFGLCRVCFVKQVPEGSMLVKSHHPSLNLKYPGTRTLPKEGRTLPKEGRRDLCLGKLGIVQGFSPCNSLKYGLVGRERPDPPPA